MLRTARCLVVLPTTRANVPPSGVTYATTPFGSRSSLFATLTWHKENPPREPGGMCLAWGCEVMTDAPRPNGPAPADTARQEALGLAKGATAPFTPALSYRWSERFHRATYGRSAFPR